MSDRNHRHAGGAGQSWPSYAQHQENPPNAYITPNQNIQSLSQPYPPQIQPSYHQPSQPPHPQPNLLQQNSQQRYAQPSHQRTRYAQPGQQTQQLVRHQASRSNQRYAPPRAGQQPSCQFDEPHCELQPGGSDSADLYFTSHSDQAENIDAFFEFQPEPLQISGEAASGSQKSATLGGAQAPTNAADQSTWYQLYVHHK